MITPASALFKNLALISRTNFGSHNCQLTACISYGISSSIQRSQLLFPPSPAFTPLQSPLLNRVLIANDHRKQVSLKLERQVSFNFLTLTEIA